MTIDRIASCFGDLADEIERRSVPGSCRGLPAAAASTLRDAEQFWSLHPAAVLEWAAFNDNLPEQSWSSDFGDPALTVARRDGFRIDLLYWVHNVTPTHRHISCGAFGAMHGSRVHRSFRFGTRSRPSPYLAAGVLYDGRTEVMKEGDVREIEPSFIHDLFWLRQPSVTVSVRCTGLHDDEGLDPWEYLEPGLAVLDRCHHPSSLVSRQSAALRLLRRSGPRRFRRALASTISTGDPILVYHACLDLLAADPVGEFDGLAALLENRGDAAGVEMARALGHMRRRVVLAGVQTGDPDAQLAVALLWAGRTTDQVVGFFDGLGSADRADAALAIALASVPADAASVLGLGCDESG